MYTRRHWSLLALPIESTAEDSGQFPPINLEYNVLNNSTEPPSESVDLELGTATLGYWGEALAQSCEYRSILSG